MCTNNIKYSMRNAQVNVVTPSAETEAPSVNHDGESEWLQTRPGERCRIRISAADTNGAYSAVEIVSDAHDGTPVHIHQNEDEHFIILEGTARIARGDKTFDAAAGTAVTLSKGVPHAWCNLSGSPLRMAVIASPGGIEEILPLIAKGGDVDIKALSEKFGVRNVGPMLSS
jgi:mannose-6-phosphate isomerase-like protein (cupin superfamily)